MAETESVSVAIANPTTTSSPAKKEKKPRNPRTKPTHPPTSEMVTNAIRGLKERGGSSLQAIKKYITANYKVDAEKVAPFIKKYLKSSVIAGNLIQTKGKGASGSFKLSVSTTTSISSAKSKEITSDKKKNQSSVKVKKSGNINKVSKISSVGEKLKKNSKKVNKIKKPLLVRSGGVGERKLLKKVTNKKSIKQSITPVAAVTSSAVGSPKSKLPSKAKKSNKPGPTKKPKAPKPKSAKLPAPASKTKKITVVSPKKKK